MVNTLNRWLDRFTTETKSSSRVHDGLQWLMLARLLALYLLLVVLILLRVFRSESLTTDQAILAYSLLGISFVFNFAQSLLIDRIPAKWWVPFANIFFDASVTSTWLFYSGGRESLFALMYLIEILAVALTFYKRGALIAAGICAAFFALVISLHPQESPYNWLAWAIYSAIFTVLGVVGGYLSEELQRTTERLKEKSRKIEKLTELHDQILAGLPTGVLTIDDASVVNFINPAAEHILGLLSRDIVGKELNSVVPDLLPFFQQIEIQEIVDNAEDAPTQAEETMASTTGPAFHRSVFLKGKTENVRLQQIVEVGKGVHRKILRGDVAALDPAVRGGRLLSHGATSGQVLLFQDVTRVWNLEEKLKQHEKLAAVGQLAAGIAHEIRNPLASMSASIELLKGTFPEGTLSTENHKLMEIALREIDRLNELITEFLDFVKPENFKVAPVDLGNLMTDVLSSVRNSKDFQAKVTIEEKIEKNIVAHANGEKIKQVLWNLLVNSAQALPKEGKIQLGCTKLNDRLVSFWVEDNGVGMSEEVLAHLYEPFFTTKPKGTGLGLATAYRIIEAHQGEIRVRSKPNQGTRFEIHLLAA